MKRILSNILLALSLIVSSCFFAGCVKEMVDINEELALGRCLTPDALEAKVANGQEVTFSWSKSKGAAKFNLELYTDEARTKLYKSYEVSIDALPYTIVLDPDLKLYGRVQAVSDNEEIAPSKWADFEEAIETTAIKSSLSPVFTAATSNSISISWTKDPEVDHIRVTPALKDGESYTKIELKDAEINAGAATVTGLKPSVKYNLAVHYFSADRGQVNAFTHPDTQGMTVVASAEQFASDLANGQTKFVFPYNEGILYELGELKVNHSLELYGEPAPTGEFPRVLVSIKFHNGGSSDARFHFEQLCLDGAPGTLYGERSNIIDIAEAVSSNKIESFTVYNCEVLNYTKNIYYDNKGISLGSLNVSESIIKNIGSASQDLFSFRAATTACKSIRVENNTIVNNHRDILRIDKCAVPDIVFKNNTVVENGLLADGGLFIVQQDVTNFDFSGNLFINTIEGEKNLIFDAKSKLPTTVANNFFYKSDSALEPNKDALVAGGGSVLDSDPCEDSVGEVFNVVNPVVLAAKAGDPRWLVPYVEVPEDLTQGVTSTITTWDLADAKVFRGKADKDMVRGDIRFYVKNSGFNLGDGKIEFTGKSEFDEAGLPVDGAMGIKVNQAGSIVISTEASELAGDHSHINVSLDGKVSAAVPVGADRQKITFPGITSEQTIYITSCGPIAITFLQWTDDVQVLNTVLDTPVLAINKQTVQERAEETVTVTWNAVDYAGSYEVTFNDKTVSVSETTFSVETAALAVEEAGADFKITVKAVPAADDYIRSASSIAEVSFHVNDVPDTPGLKVVRYELAIPDAATSDEKYACDGNGNFFIQATGGLAVDANNACFAMPGDAEFLKYTHRLKSGGATSDTKTITINVPNDGVLYIAARSSSSGDMTRTMSLVQGEKVILEPTLVKDEDMFYIGEQKVYPYTVANVKAGEIKVVLNNGINFYGIRYDATEGEAAPDVDPTWVSEATVWGNEFFTEIKDVLYNGVSEIKEDFVHGKLTFTAGGGKFKPGVSSELTRIQFGGSGSLTKQCISFLPSGPGTLTATVQSSSSSSDRVLIVADAQGNVIEEIAAPGAEKNTGSVLIAATPGEPIYLYSKSSGINLFEITWTPNN